MTTNQSAERNRRLFSSAFFNYLVSAISESSGSPWLVAAVSAPAAAAEESEPVRLNLTLEGSLRGELLLEFHRAEVAMLAAKCLRQPTGDYGEEQSRAVLRFVQDGANAFCSAVAEEYGIFAITASSTSESSSDPSNVEEMGATDDTGNRISILIYLNPALTEALSLRVEAGGSARTAEDAQTMDDHTKEGKAIAEQFNLTLVMDVELNVTLRFGQRQLALREVLELTSGSVVELDRQVDEPVELLLEGKVIAKGEAVVIDGNYGLRVTEVPQPISPAVVR